MASSVEKLHEFARALVALLTSVLLFSSLSIGAQTEARAVEDPSRFLTQEFDASREFPNLFLPEPYRHLPPDQVPKTVVDQSHRLLEQALSSVFSRLIMPIVPAGEKTPRQTRYFPYLQKELSKIDPNVKVYASGGVVRSAISYLYDEVYQGLQRHPQSSSQEILESIARATHDLPAGKVRGVGSDFDLLIDSPGGKSAELQKQAEVLTNSVATSFGSHLKGGAVKNTLFTMGDVRDYGTQIERSTRQGGSTVDYMAFSIVDQSIRNPPRFPNVSRDLIAGVYDFAPPERAEFVEDGADTVIRGYRTLLETPWLRLKDERTFRTGIRKLIEELEEGKSFSKRAKGQFAKGLRNSRYFGAHNRFYRAKPGSVEAEVMKFVRALNARDSVVYLPEFADAIPIDRRKSDRSELKGLPSEILEDPKKFIRESTSQGKVFHGTPSIESALAILRQGLFLSKDGQGTAAVGRGVYTDKDIGTPRQYAGAAGVVFELPLKNDPRINILDWSKNAGHPAIQKIAEKAKSKGRDVFEYLAREHGIDIIKNGYVLIQNSEAVEFPKGVQALLRPLASQFSGKKSLSASEIGSYAEFRRLQDYARLLGEPLTLSSDECTRLDQVFAPQGLKHSNPEVRSMAVGIVGSLPPSLRVPMLLEAIGDADENARVSAFEVDWNGVSNRERFEFLKRGLNDSPQVEKAALKQFLLLSNQEQDQVADFLKRNKGENAFSKEFMRAYYLNGAGSPEDLPDWIAHGLKQKKWSDRQFAAEFIGKAPSKNQPELFAQAWADTYGEVRRSAFERVNLNLLSDVERNRTFQDIFWEDATRDQELGLRRFMELSQNLQSQTATAILHRENGRLFPVDFVKTYYLEGGGSRSELARWIDLGLKHRDWTIRESMAKLIGKVPVEEQTALLGKALADAHGNVQVAALDSVDLSKVSIRLDLVVSALNSTEPKIVQFGNERFRLLPKAHQSQAAALLLERKRSHYFPKDFITTHYLEGDGASEGLAEWIRHGLLESAWKTKQFSAEMIRKLPVELQRPLFEKAWKEFVPEVRYAGLKNVNWNSLPDDDRSRILLSALESEYEPLRKLALERYQQSSGALKEKFSAFFQVEIKRSACSLEVQAAINALTQR